MKLSLHLLSLGLGLSLAACTQLPIQQQANEAQKTDATTTTSASTESDEVSGAAAAFLLDDVQSEDSQVGSEMSADDVVSAWKKKRDELIAKYDTNKDGSLDKDERAAMHAEMKKEFLAKYDTNGDGKIDQDEIKAVIADIKAKIEEFRKMHAGKFEEKRKAICEKIQSRCEAHKKDMMSHEKPAIPGDTVASSGAKLDDNAAQADSANPVDSSGHSKGGFPDNGLLDRIKLRCEDGDISADPQKDQANVPGSDGSGMEGSADHEKMMCEGAQKRATELGDAAKDHVMLQDILDKCKADGF